MYVCVCHDRYVDDPLSEVLLHRKVPIGSLLFLDLDRHTGEVTVEEMQETVTVVEGHGSGYMGNIVVKTTPTKTGGSDGAQRARSVERVLSSGALEDS